ncbi:MAG: DUF6485 family protein [Christensenella sp.]
MECQKEKNMAWCNCSFGCSKQGMCCECVKYHRELGELPACYFSKSAEKTGDRSIAAYLKDKNQ